MTDAGDLDLGFPAKHLSDGKEATKMIPSMTKTTPNGATIVHLSFHRQPCKSIPDTD
jgi:hypothetical protein